MIDSTADRNTSSLFALYESFITTVLTIYICFVTTRIVKQDDPSKPIFPARVTPTQLYANDTVFECPSISEFDFFCPKATKNQWAEDGSLLHGEQVEADEGMEEDLDSMKEAMLFVLIIFLYVLPFIFEILEFKNGMISYKNIIYCQIIIVYRIIYVFRHSFLAENEIFRRFVGALRILQRFPIADRADLRAGSRNKHSDQNHQFYPHRNWSLENSQGNYY